MASTRWTMLLTRNRWWWWPRPARRRAATCAKCWRDAPFLRFDRTQRTGLQIDRVLRRLGVSVNDFLELNAIETLVELVRQEVGVTALLNGASWRDGEEAARAAPAIDIEAHRPPGEA